MGAAANAQTSGCLGIFTLPEVRELTDFVSAAFFQHFLLYQSVLVCRQQSITKHVQVSLDHPHAPPDLRRAKPRASRTSAGLERTNVEADALSATATLAQPSLVLPEDALVGDQAIAASPDGARSAAGSPSNDAAMPAPPGMEELSVDEHFARASASA